MVGKRKIISITIVSAIVFLLGSIGISNAQLLYRPEMEIENYARTGYHLYGRTQINRSSNPRYDEFGNYIMDGVRIFSWDEQKINSRHENKSEKYSVMSKVNPVDDNEFFDIYLDNLVMLRESTKEFSSRFIVGNEVRVKFSPLTLNMTAMNGIRWDMNYADNNVTLISSRADTPLWFPADVLLDDSQNRLIPVYLTGAHIERKLGVVNLSANYVNTYKSNSALSRSQNSITGTIANGPVYNSAGQEANTGHIPVPLQIAVKIEDQSRYDQGGPRIYEIYPIVDGVPRPELLIGVSEGNWRDDFRLAQNQDDPNRQLYEARYMLDPMRVPDYAEFNGFNNIRDLPDDVLARRFDVDSDPEIEFSDLNEGKDFLECNGEDYLIFWFEVPSRDVQSYKFKALIGNNYKISMAEIFENNQSSKNTAQLGNVSATYFEPMVYARGDVKDMSNLDWVSFEWGQATANMLMSLRMDADIKGFKFVGEYSRNMQFRQYMNELATKQRYDADAYYLNVRKDFGKFSFGTELFKIDPEYRTSFINFDQAYKGMSEAWQSQMSADPYLRGMEGAQTDIESFSNYTWVIDNVDDNDDKDRYPDFHVYTGVRDRNGVYPGLDRNGNNRPDTNENDNLSPDYSEAFFLYNVDPDEYDYGYDLNQNSVIDVRENDDKPDYPYNVNTQGFHIFGSYGTDIGWKYTLGYLDKERIAGGGITDVKYGSVEYNKFIPFFADVKFSSIVKKVEDSIQDDVYRYATQLTTTLVDSSTYGYNLDVNNILMDDMLTERYWDPLRYRDSYVSKSYFETNLFRIRNLNIGMKLKYEINHQNETGYQDENDLIDRTQIYRGEYKYYLRDLLINPQVKFTNRKYTNSDGRELTLHEQHFYPIIKVEYPITTRTVFRFGMQGFPGLNATTRNLVNDQLDYDTRHMVVMLSNNSFYSGYDFTLNFGYQSTWQEFNGFARQAYNRTDRVYFVRLVVGLEPIS